MSEENTRGGPHPGQEGGGAPTPTGRPPVSWPPWWPSGAHLLLYEGFYPGKKSEASLRDETPPPRGGTNLGLWQSCSAGDNSLREGEIITIVITNAPLIGRRQSPSTYSPAPSHLQTLVHLLYPIFVSKPQIGTCRLLVVLITPCS